MCMYAGIARQFICVILDSMYVCIVIDRCVSIYVCMCVCVYVIGILYVSVTLPLLRYTQTHTQSLSHTHPYAQMNIIQTCSDRQQLGGVRGSVGPARPVTTGTPAVSVTRSHSPKIVHRLCVCACVRV